MRHELSKLRSQSAEYERQIVGYEKSHKLTLSHIRGLEEENLKLRHASATPPQALLRDLAVLQEENSLLHERLLTTSRQLGQLLGRVEELKGKIHAMQAVESDECRGEALKSLTRGMDAVRRKVLRDHGIADHPLERENAELRDRIRELESQTRAAERKEEIAQREIAELRLKRDQMQGVIATLRAKRVPRPAEEPP